MRVEEKAKAREFRKEGKSIREITRLLNVAKSSVSVWVRDIKLTKEQELNLIERNNGNSGPYIGSSANKEKNLEIRKKYQEEGKIEARKKEWLFVAGCMLYWGEGSKRRNTVGLANSDPYLLKLFLKFLYNYFDVKKEEISVFLQYHVDDGQTNEYYENFWLKELNLTKENLCKSNIDHRPRTSVHKGKGRKCLYGCCTVFVYRTDIVQKIYGGIQEIGGFEKENWLKN